MTLLLLLLMGFHLHGEIVHEWSGIVFTLLILLHLYLNRHRFWSLSPALPNRMLLVKRVMNMVTLLIILTAIVSGLMLSRHVLLNMPFHNPETWVRKTHMTAVHWGMLVLALHIGMHWKMLARFFCQLMHIPERSRVAHIMMPALFSLITLLGIYRFIQRDSLAYLLMQVDFSFFDYDESALLFYSDTLSIIIAFAFMTRILLWLFIFRQQIPRD